MRNYEDTVKYALEYFNVSVWDTFFVKDMIIHFPSEIKRTYYTQDEALQDKDMIKNFYNVFQALSCSKAVKLLPLDEYLKMDGGTLWKM